MANYNSLKATVNANIKANNNEEITGTVLNSVLSQMINTLGAGYQYMGVATPSYPGTDQTPDQRCFYLATTPGIYAHLGGLVVEEGEVTILMWDTSWTKETPDVASLYQLHELGQRIIKKYDNEEVCLVGEYREYNGKIYKCTFPVLEPHVFRESEFEEVVFSSDLLRTLCLGDDYSVYLETITANGNVNEDRIITIGAGEWAIIIPDGYTFTTADFQNYNGEVVNISIVGVAGMYSVDKSLYNERVPYILFKVEQRSAIQIRVRADEGTEGTFVLIKNPDNNVLAAIKGASFARVLAVDNSVNALKPFGVLACNVHLQTPDSFLGDTDFAVRVFDKSNVQVGESLMYRIHLSENYAAGYNVYVRLNDVNGRMISIHGKTSIAQGAKVYEGEFVIPANFDYADFMGTCPAAILDYICTKDGLLLYGERITAVENSISYIEETIEAPNVTWAEDVLLSDSPRQIFKNNDSHAIPNVDDGLLNQVCVLKMSDNLFYMYYESMGLNDPDLDSTLRLCFAYSTDGFNYVKGFPAGVTAPIPGTNMLLPQGSTHGPVIVKVQDGAYPYRMVACGFNQSETYIPVLWRSADGIHWEKLRELSAGGNDSPISCVVRGNTLKIFVRSYSPNGRGRTVGIICTDLDGNLYMPKYWNPAKSCISLEDSERQLYQASASILDDKREILFPTIYNPNNSEQSVGCLILDGDNFKELNFDDSLINTSQIKSIYVSPGIVNIGLDTYIFYVDRDTDHEHFQIGVTQSRIMMEKLIIR